MSVSDRILDKLIKKNAGIGFRTDIAVADLRPLNNSTAAVLLSYNRNVAEISSEQIGQYFINNFSGRIAPVMATAKNFPKQSAISIIAELVDKKRPYEDKEKMMAVGSAMFIDTVLNETYEVKSTPTGTKFLAKVCADNIHNIVAERNKRMAITASNNVSFESINTVTGFAILDDGDKIKFYHMGEIKKGEIIAVGDKITIKSDTGETIKTEKSAVIDVISKSQKALNEGKTAELEFYTKMYGDENFAKQLLGIKPSGM
jgi:hypothetical protein